MKHFCEVLLDGIVYFCRVYVRGWSVVFRFLAAHLIVSLFMWPFAGVAWLVGLIPVPHDGTGAGILFRLLLGCLAFLIYVPPVIYVAASWVGFCPRLEDAKERDDQG